MKSLFSSSIIGTLCSSQFLVLLLLPFISRSVHAFGISSGCHLDHVRSRPEHQVFYTDSPHLHRTTYQQVSSGNEDNPSNAPPAPPSVLEAITLYAPIWTSLAAIIGITQTKIVSPLLGSLSIIQNSLALLMLVMGLTITPTDLSRVLKSPSVLMTNAVYCYGMMPLVAVGMSKLFSYNTSETAGIILLASVSGGQASNLFTLLAGGDVALSVVCTLTTTILGVLATPILVQSLLGCSVAVNGLEVFRSVTNLALLPLLTGLSLGCLAPRTVSRIQHLCPPLGVLTTLILVAGGASNSASLLAVNQGTAIIASCVLPIVGGGLALASMANRKLSEKSKRALVIETLSKSPTLAYVLARKHFDSKTAAIPAAAMVSLAIIGAVVSSVWSSIRPIND